MSAEPLDHGCSQQPARVRVAIVDDHAAVALGLAALLGQQPDLDFVWSGAAVDGLIAADCGADVVVLDLRLGDGSQPGDNVQRAASTGAKVIAFTSGESVELMREASRAGVDAVVLKSEPTERLVAAIEAVRRGVPFVSTEWAAALDSDPDLADAGLSRREREVLRLYASGEKAYSVARELDLSRETVNDYIRRIRKKYGQAGRPAPTKVDLYRRAVEDGVITRS